MSETQTKAVALTPQHQAWVKLADFKATTFQALQNGELVVQGFLNNIQTIHDLPVIQEKIKQAKAQAAEDKQRRLYFTNMIAEKITSPAMEFEKRNEALIATASQHELTVRKKLEEDQNESNKKATEINKFKAHIENEHFRIASEYRVTLNEYITEGYKKALENKLDRETLANHIAAIKQFIKDTKLPAFVKFERTLITDEEALSIFKSIRSYDATNDLNAALAKVDNTFAMFEQDLANAAAAIKQAEKEQAELKLKEDEQRQQEAAMNNLVASATVVSENSVTVKRKYAIEIENSEQWAIAIITAFVKNWLGVKQHLKVKTWGNLKLEQMANALAAVYNEHGDEVKLGEFIKLKQIEK